MIFDNMKENKFFKCKYSYIEGFIDGFAIVRLNNRSNNNWGVVDKNDKEIYECKYNWYDILILSEKYKLNLIRKNKIKNILS
jgi:hypothetical protein